MSLIAPVFLAAGWFVAVASLATFSPAAAGLAAGVSLITLGLLYDFDGGK